MPNSRAAFTDGRRQNVAPQNAAENVDEHGLHRRIAQQNPERVLDLVPR
jgi:hypothetical protein